MVVSLKLKYLAKTFETLTICMLLCIAEHHH